MKGERKLRLVSGGSAGSPGGPGDEPPFTEEEIAAAAALREALDAGGEPLFTELKAAHVPGLLAPADLDAIVSRALGDEASATAAERTAAERLRAEIGGEAPFGEGAELLVSLRLAAHPTDLPAARHRALIEAALARVPIFGRGGPAVRRIAPVTMAALASVAAIAAGLALFAGRVPASRPSDATLASAALVRARSADDLFDAATPFPRHGQESARIDRITSARTADLRKNRFTAWGVK